MVTWPSVKVKEAGYILSAEEMDRRVRYDDGVTGVDCNDCPNILADRASREKCS